MRLVLLALLTASAALAQPADRAVDEPRVMAALDAAVVAARSGDAEAAAPLFACFTPPDRVFFPCDAGTNPDRIADVMHQVTDAFGTDISYVADSYHAEREGDVTFHLVQVKVRRQAPPDLAFLTFVNVDGQFLLAEVVGTQRTPPTPQPADAEARVKARMETILQHASDLDVVAPLIGCYANEGGGSYRVWPCDPSVLTDRARAEGFTERLQALVRQAGPTGYGFVQYLTDTEREGTWHILQIDYLQPGGATGSLYASFMEIDGQFLLGDLNEH